VRGVLQIVVFNKGNKQTNSKGSKGSTVRKLRNVRCNTRHYVQNILRVFRAEQAPKKMLRNELRVLTKFQVCRLRSGLGSGPRSRTWQTNEMEKKAHLKSLTEKTLLKGSGLLKKKRSETTVESLGGAGTEKASNWLLSPFAASMRQRVKGRIRKVRLKKRFRNVLGYQKRSETTLESLAGACTEKASNRP